MTIRPSVLCLAFAFLAAAPHPSLAQESATHEADEGSRAARPEGEEGGGEASADGLPEATNAGTSSTASTGSEDGDGEGAAEPPPQAPAPPRQLRVAVAGSAPYVVDADGELGGIAVDTFAAVADELGWRTRLVRVDTVDEAIDGVASGRFAAAVGPISITSERARRVAFTQPFEQSSLAILARPSSAGFWEHIEPFLTRRFFETIALLLIVLTFVGVVLWLVERGKNPDFDASAARGIGSGVWFALVTMTTVGYGDKAPKTFAGRVLTSVWMVLAMVTASSLTAGIATALTLARIEHATISDATAMSGRRVAAVRGTTASAFVRRYNAELVAVEDVATGLAALEAGEADAIVHDRPILDYALRDRPAEAFIMAPERYEPLGYGFALDPREALTRDVNVALLTVEERGGIAAILERYR